MNGVRATLSQEAIQEFQILQLLHHRNQSSPRLNQFANFPTKKNLRGMLVEYGLLPWRWPRSHSVNKVFSQSNSALTSG